MPVNEIDCPDCNGSGILGKYTEQRTCSNCGGTGKITGWNAVSPASLEYNSSGFMDELTNPTPEPFEFYAGGMVQGGDPRGYSPDQSDVKATGHQKYVDMAEQDYDAGGGLFSQQDYEDEYAKGNMREVQDDDKSDYDLDQELKHYQVTPFRNKSKKKMREEVLQKGGNPNDESNELTDKEIDFATDELEYAMTSVKQGRDRQDTIDTLRNAIEQELPQQEMPDQVEEPSEEEETLQSLKAQYTIDTLKGDIKNLKLEQDKQDARIIMDELVQEEILPVIEQLKMDIVQGLQTPNEVPTEIPNGGNDEIKSMQEESHMCNNCIGKAFEMLKSSHPSFKGQIGGQRWTNAIAELESIDRGNQVFNDTPDDNRIAKAIELDLVDITTGDIDIGDQLRRLKKYFKDLDQRISPSPFEVEGGLTLEDIQKLSAEQDPEVDEEEFLINEVAKRTDQDEFICPKCDYKTNIKEEFEDHKITHDDYYMRQDESISHLQETHHMCGGCNQTFLSSAGEHHLFSKSDNSKHAQIINKATGVMQSYDTKEELILGANCNVCGMHFEGNLISKSDWTNQHHEETGHGEFSIFMLSDKKGKNRRSIQTAIKDWDDAGESSIDPEYKWELIDNEWIPIGRTKNAHSKIKRQNIFVGDMIEAD